MCERFSQKITKNEVKVLGLGDFLKHIRTRHGLTQTQMGDIFYRNKDYVYLLENDKATPTVEELKLISEKLDEPVVMLVMYGLAVNKIFQ